MLGVCDGITFIKLWIVRLKGFITYGLYLHRLTQGEDGLLDISRYIFIRSLIIVLIVLIFENILHEVASRIATGWEERNTILSKGLAIGKIYLDDLTR